MRNEKNYSPGFNQSYFVADNVSVLEETCPIDGAQIQNNTGYGYSTNSCPACGAHYGELTQEKLASKAQSYVTEIADKVKKHRQEIEKLEGILTVAKEYGKLEP